MSEFNPSVVKQKLPGIIDDILTQHKRAVDACDTIDDLAKQTGAQQAIDDAAAYRQSIESMYEFVQRMCGHEGDTAAEQGSLWAVIEVAKKMEIATGGAN